MLLQHAQWWLCPSLALFCSMVSHDHMAMLCRVDRTSSDASEYGSVTQSPDTGAWLTNTGAHSLSGARPVGSTLPGMVPSAAYDGVAAAAVAAHGVSGSLRTDSWMMPGVPAVDGIQLPELPSHFHHGSAAEFPIFPDDDGALFDALHGG